MTDERTLSAIDVAIAGARASLEALEELRSELLGNGNGDDRTRLCRLLAQAVGVWAGRRPAVTSGWIREAGRLLELDKVTPEEAAEVIEWLGTAESRDAEFWRGNVLSMPKFRKQYDKLRLARRRDGARGDNDRATRIAAGLRKGDGR